MPALLRRLLSYVALATGLAVSSAGGQSSATVPLTDPSYGDLQRLEAFGLIPRGATSDLPYSIGRVRDLVLGARRLLDERAGSDGGVLRDLEALLSRLEQRFGTSGEAISGSAEVELGGGRSPGHGTPAIDTEQLDAVTNPLWAYRGGRAFGDRLTAAAAARTDIPLGSALAFGVGGRASVLDASADSPGRRGGVFEALYARARLGSLAIEIGRDGVSWSRPGEPGLALSTDGPPLDMVRLSTDRPLPLHVLGDTEFSLFVADLGPRQSHAHAKLFGLRMEAHPTAALAIGASMLNKQMGEGAPTASTWERIRDLSLFWDLFRGDNQDRFSDKMVGLDWRLTVPSARGLALFGEGVLTDFDRNRIGEVLNLDGGYRIGMSLSRLGASQRHGFLVQAQRLGPLVYRHHQFTSGMAVDGYLQGSALGPGSASIEAHYEYNAASSGWQAGVAGTLERRSVDPYLVRYTPVKDIYRAGDLPDEHRGRIEFDLVRWLDRGRGGVSVDAGIERVTNFDYVGGASRTDVAASARFWHVF